MDISLIIATRNRADRLPALFDAVAYQYFPDDVRWEVLIIDNGSSDQTLDLLSSETEMNRLPLKCLEEKTPGKSRALNKALEVAKGDLIVFTDDDIHPDPNWLNAFKKAARLNLKHQGFCGRVLPLWEGTLPNWLNEYGLDILPEGAINKRDYGAKSRTLPLGTVPGGVNAALRKESIKKMGPFREDIGPGTGFPYAEDTEFMLRLNKMGMQYLYVPEALVYHRNEPSRMTESYATRWVKEVAQSQIIALHSETQYPMINGYPRYLLQSLLSDYIAWVCGHKKKYRMKRKLSFFKTLGEIKGFHELKHRSN